MKQTTEMDFNCTVTMREDAQQGGPIATIEGMAVPYSTPTKVGGVSEQFAPASFNPADVLGRSLNWRHGDPVGVITSAENRANGLFITADVLDTAQGRDAATLTRAGAVKGLSVGFQPITSRWNQARTAVTHTAAQFFEVSLTHMPAYATAGISSIREEEKVSETTIEETPVVSEDTAAREAIATLRETVNALEARSHVTEPVHPFAQYRSLGEYRLACMTGTETRALFDQVTDDNPGVLPPIWSQIVRGIFDLGRPTITAFGVMAAGTTGTTFNWPYWDGDLMDIVAEQVDEKDEVNSVQISLLKGTATLKTYAAGSDISYQLLQRSSPSYVDAHTRIMLNSYVQVTDLAFVAAVYAARTVQAYDLSGDTDGSKFRAGVFEASVAVQTATGMPAEFVLVSPDIFVTIGGWSTFFPSNYGTYNVSGTAQSNTLGVSVSGLPVILDRNIGGNTILVSNREAAKWIEDGPRIAQNENAAQLGRDVAVYGYGASQIINGGAIIALTDS